MKCKIGAELVPDFTEMINDSNPVCPVAWTKECICIAREQSCGQSVVCRDGLTQMLMIITDITSGFGRPDDIELLREIATYAIEDGGCETAIKAAEQTIETLTVHTEEWNDHIKRKRCSKFVCKSYYSVICYPDKCQGCNICMKTCPVNAISGGPGMICVVDESICIRCGKCIEVCPHEARGKVGSVRPKLPEKPVLVGSFSNNSKGGRRRRRPHRE